MAFLVANSYLGLVKEATRGTTPASAGTAAQLQWVPVVAPQITPTQVFLRDEALRGSPTLVYDQIQGVRHDLVDFRTYLYADSFPILVASLLGGTDNVTTSGASTHVISQLNNAATGSQPSSYSILDFDGANWFLMNGAQAGSLGITFGAEAAAEGTVKFMANPYTSGTTLASVATGTAFSAGPAITGEHMIPAWDTTVSLGGTSLGYIQSGELTIDRKTAPIFTVGNQKPYQIFAGPTEVTGKITAVVDTNNDPFSTTASAYALTRSPQTIVITLTDPNDLTSSTAHSLSFQMTAVQTHDVKRLRGKQFTEVEFNFTANANTTDGSSTNYSPVKFTAVNGVTTAYN